MRPFTVTSLLAVAAFIAAPANATTVFSDNFNSENGGASFLNYRSFTNFESTGRRDVDLVATPDFGITCAGGSGSCVDLDGSPGPGDLTSRASFGFGAGDKIRLTFDLGGSQRSQAFDDFTAFFNFVAPVDVIDYGANFFGADTILNPGLTAGSSVMGTGINVAGNNPFSTRSIFFTAGSAGSLKFGFGTSSGDNVGPLLDNVSLSIAAVPEPATWAMMLGGFGLVGGAMRRRTKMQTTIV